MNWSSATENPLESQPLWYGSTRFSPGETSRRRPFPAQPVAAGGVADPVAKTARVPHFEKLILWIVPDAAIEQHRALGRASLSSPAPSPLSAPAHRVPSPGESPLQRGLLDQVIVDEQLAADVDVERPWADAAGAGNGYSADGLDGALGRAWRWRPCRAGRGNSASAVPVTQQMAPAASAGRPGFSTSPRRGPGPVE